jgi:hypothetical protein
MNKILKIFEFGKESKRILIFLWIKKYFYTNYPSIIIKIKVSCSKVNLKEFEFRKNSFLYFENII